MASKSSDPEAAAAEARRLAAEISGIPNAPVMPQLDEANLDPTMKVLLQMVRAQGEALTELRTERVSARAQESVDDALSKFPLFQNDKGSRDLGALVSLALLKDNPTADVNEVAAHVHGLIGKVTQSQITKAREARESANGAPVVPAGSGLVSFSPPETPMTVKEAKSGAMADAIRSALKKFQGGITPG